MAALLVLTTACSSSGSPRPVAAPSAGPSPQTPAPSVTADPPASAPSSYDDEFAALERDFDARLGVYAVDTGSGEEVAYRADERFAYASTIKALAAAAVLERTSDEQLDEVVTFGAEEVVSYSPVTAERVDTGMTLRELCDAAVRFSDNTAANLLLQELGGPDGLAVALADVGDDVTKVVRTEPELNEALPGDERDTSTPRAMATSLRAYAVDDALSPQDQAPLTGWLRGSTTGTDLIRSAVPDGWAVGDKSGTGGFGTRNDVAVLWPPGREPLVVVTMSDRDRQGADDALLASAAEVVVDALAGAG
jgi:beta-lactamase class A